MGTSDAADGSGRDRPPVRAAAEEVCNYLNDKSLLQAEAYPVGEDVTIHLREKGFLDPCDVRVLDEHGFVITGAYPESRDTGSVVALSCHHESNLDEVGWNDG